MFNSDFKLKAMDTCSVCSTEIQYVIYVLYILPLIYITFGVTIYVCCIWVKYDTSTKFAKIFLWVIIATTGRHCPSHQVSRINLFCEGCRATPKTRSIKIH